MYGLQDNQALRRPTGLIWGLGCWGLGCARKRKEAHALQLQRLLVSRLCSVPLQDATIQSPAGTGKTADGRVAVKDTDLCDKIAIDEEVRQGGPAEASQSGEEDSNWNSQVL